MDTTTTNDYDAYCAGIAEKTVSVDCTQDDFSKSKNWRTDNEKMARMCKAIVDDLWNNKTTVLELVISSDGNIKRCTPEKKDVVHD